MKLVIVGYAEMEDFFLFDEDGNRVKFETEHIFSPADFTAKYGIEVA